MSHRNNGRMHRDDDESTVSKIFKGLLVGAAVVGVGALLGYTLYKLTEEELNKIPVQLAGRNGMPLPNEECSICLDPFKRDQHIKQLPCKHIYHDECIQQWVKTNSSCPLCRKRV